MTPHLRRTWAPIGQTPVLHQRTRSRDKVSMIGALTVSPGRRRVGLYFSLFPNENVTDVVLIAFLRHLRSQLQGRIILIWDRLGSHKSLRMQQFLARQTKIRIEYLPPYAPELNPVEGLWSYLKMNPLANLPAWDATDMFDLATFYARRVQRNQDLLRSFIRGTPLLLRLR